MFAVHVSTKVSVIISPIITLITVIFLEVLSSLLTFDSQYLQHRYIEHLKYAETSDSLSTELFENFIKVLIISKTKLNYIICNKNIYKNISIPYLARFFCDCRSSRLLER